MVGCCTLATEGALRSGAGLVTLAFPDCLYTALTSRLTENLFLSLSTNNDGCISSDSINTLLKACKNSDVIMVGCGLGTSESIKELVKALVTQNEKPLIMDADALNCLSEFNDILLNKKCEILLTPHPGEMSRLCGLSVSDIEANREEIIVDFCETYKVNVLLKGHETLICNSSADCLYVNKTGNTGLSKGGAGDLLSGIIAGLTPAMKGNLFNSAILGAFVHGLSADLLKNEISEYSILPSDCAKTLGKVYSLLENEQG
jgi:NAD(P)H-hydrate epimerase